MRARARASGPTSALGLGLTAWRVLFADEEGIFPKGTTVQGFAADGDRYEKLQRTDLTLAAELGAEWWVSEGFSLRLGARYHVLPGNDLDNIGLSSQNAYANVGVRRRQQGPGPGLWSAPPLVRRRQATRTRTVSRTGATPARARPRTSTASRTRTAAPTTTTTATASPTSDDACPDEPEDRDGFQDEDGCPDPDNDGDGVIDARDRAPDQAEDMDGFQDQDGVPDLDNDQVGVPDTMDTCPDTPLGTAVDAKGCPLPEPEPDPQIQAIEDGLVLEGVKFKSGSSEILPSSLAVLQKVSESLKGRPEVRVEVRGHTDAVGSAELNRKLSHRRAIAVRDFLIQLGVTPAA